MKLFFLPAFLFLFLHSFSQSPVSDSVKIGTFCKVWGFLKYHHPAVAKGKCDWDKVFTAKLEEIEKLNNREEINEFYYNWISELGKLKRNRIKKFPADAIFSNYDVSWLKDSSLFTNRVTDLLLLAQSNSSEKNHYVKKNFFGIAATSYTNEKAYADSIHPSTVLRLLTLSRYWNIVNYFYPYKYLTDANWQNVIYEFVPEFIEAENSKTYHLLLLQLFAKLNDSHAGFNPQLYGSSYHLPPFSSKIIDNKIVVLNAFNDSLCRKYDIRYGDVISKINGKPVADLIQHFSKYISASNFASLCMQLTPQIIWNGVYDSSVITWEREGNVFEKRLPSYPVSLIREDFSRFREKFAKNNDSDSYRMLNQHIAYINLGKIKSRKDIKSVLKTIQNTDAVILDIRNYPDASLFRPVTNFFCTSKKPFAKFATGSIRHPGVFVWRKTVFCGRSKGTRYKGRIAVLTNEATISFAEYFTMALKTIPNVILIGSHTAGADGNNQHFVLPGNITTSFSNEGVYFPNAEQTQRIGIVPDIEVLPTIESIRSGEDRVLQKAVEVLNEKIK